MALSSRIRTAVADLAGRLRMRVKNSHRLLGRELQGVLDNSADPSCCTRDTVDHVKSVVLSPTREPSAHDGESVPR
jgi:hypothetical protein